MNRKWKIPRNSRAEFELCPDRIIMRFAGEIFTVLLTSHSEREAKIAKHNLICAAVHKKYPKALSTIEYDGKINIDFFTRIYADDESLLAFLEGRYGQEETFS